MIAEDPLNLSGTRRIDGRHSATAGVCARSPYLNGLTIVPPQNSYHPNGAGCSGGYPPAFSGAV
ncbi:hypothetical protein [Actinoplanes sp. G11-F43]|uniref:hypothetical protein n=1 Tax=Actinoplanes sp. G11-F43 TaxID=3424130 RepID=UPI003D3411DD